MKGFFDRIHGVRFESCGVIKDCCVSCIFRMLLTRVSNVVVGDMGFLVGSY